MTELSPDDKYAPDGAMQRLLDLDGEIMDMGEGYWVQVRVKRIDPDELRPHGINYSLCLLSPDDECLLRYDNAHPIRVKGTMTETSDHVHKGSRIEPYGYIDPEELMCDFWTETNKVLKEKGVQ